MLDMLYCLKSLIGSFSVNISLCYDAKDQILVHD